MSLRINHNIDAMVGQKNLASNSANLSKSLQRLSSGLRINSAADDAAGLVISEQMRAQITGLNQAVSNTQNAVSMVQTTEGALDEMNSLLNKARQLTLDAANTGVNDTNQLSADQSELDNVISSVTRISQVTQFGTKNLLDGSLNGVTKDSVSAGLSNIRVGNLANNSAITVGAVTVTVAKATQQSITLKNTGGTNSYITSGSGGITGVHIGGKTIRSGVTVSLTLGSGGGTTVSYKTTSVQTAAQIASGLNALAASKGYAVTVTGGDIKVTRNGIGNNPFKSVLSFNRTGTLGAAGRFEAVTATLKATSGTFGTPRGDIAAAQIFSGVTHLGDAQATTTVRSGTKFSYVIKTATGGSISGTVSGGGANNTLAKVMSGLRNSIKATATFTGATVSLGTGMAAASSGLQIKLTRGDDSILTDFSFSLTVDYKNNAAVKGNAEVISMNTAFTTGANSTFTTSTGGLGGLYANMSGASKLRSGSSMTMIISGQTITLTGNRTMTQLATAFQAAVHGLGGNLANVNVAFVASGATKFTGIAGASGLQMTGAVSVKGFVVYSTDGRTFNVSMKVDQKDGSDAKLTVTHPKSGAVAGATLDLTTVGQARISGKVSGANIAAATVSSKCGNSVIHTGTTLNVSMATSNGVKLDLVTTFTTATGSLLMTLSSGSKAKGYQNFSMEVDQTLSLQGGVKSFTLNNGAEFQIGSNGGQQVGLTIDSATATDLGRNVVTSLASLGDMVSSKKGALTNGLTGDALKVIDAAINQVTNLRGTLGAFQANTLQSGLNSLQVSRQNLTAAESTIRDVDFASESASFTKNQILVQASTSMLAQANQLPQSVLKLLG